MSAQKSAIRLLAGVTVVVILLGTVASVGGIFTPVNPGSNSSTTDFPPSYAVHWHFPIEMTVCGQPYEFTEKEEHGRIIHGHNDRLIHIEGKIENPDEVTIGNFFDSIGLEFGNDHIAEYKSGETMCPDGTTPGTLKVTANGVVLDDPENYILDYEKQDITVVFE